MTAVSGAAANRRLDIQGLRAIAVLTVVAFHAALPVSGGFVGVDVFFVISGFVISAMLQREWAETGTVSLSQFYLRRFKRLTPALAVTTAVTCVLGLLFLSPFGTQTRTAEAALGAMMLVANFAIARSTGGYFDAPAETNPLLNMWSLSVEEQFYLVFPGILFLGWSLGRKSGRRSVGLWAVGLIGLASLSCAMLGAAGVSFRGSHLLFGFYSPVSRTWEFAAGALLALLGTKVSLPNRGMAQLAGGLGGLLLLASLWLIDGTRTFPGPWTILPVVATMLLLLGGAVPDSGTARILSAAPLVKVGDLSYSIYLWHWPLIVFAAALWPGVKEAKVLAALVSVLPALASYRWVETPLRAHPALPGRGLARLVFSVVAAPIVLAALLWGASRFQWYPASVSSAVAAVMHEHVPTERGCMERGPYKPSDVEKCVWNAELTGSPVYLVGDSNAWQFAEAAIEGARLGGHPSWVFTAPSCAVVAGLRVRAFGKSDFFPVPWPDTEFSHCPAFVDFTLGWLGRAPPGVVVLASLDQYWWDATLGASLNDGPVQTDSDRKAGLLEEGLRSTIQQLRAAGHRVVLVQSIPTFRNPAPIWEPRSCAVMSVMRGTCSRETSLDVVDLYQRGSRQAVERAARDSGASVLDLRSEFCPGARCTTHREAAWLYMDATHITVDMSLSLAPAFRRALDETP